METNKCTLQCVIIRYLTCMLAYDFSDFFPQPTRNFHMSNISKNSITCINFSTLLRLFAPTRLFGTSE